MMRKIVLSLALVTSGAPLALAEDAATAAESIITMPDLGDLSEEEIASSLLEIARRKHADRSADEARTALYSILELRPGSAIEVPALLLLADSYHQSVEYARSVAILERVQQDYASSPKIPRVLLELGRHYRIMGAESLALSRFYAVLNATLKIPAAHLEDYQLIARTAQYEIAETHLTSGRFEEASKYFQRLSLFDLAPEDRARAQFKTAHAAYLGENFAEAARQLKELLATHADLPEEAEARFLLAVSLEKIGRDEASLDAALELFASDRSADDHQWRYWQRRTGNHLANEFFRKGRMAAAHALYSELATLSDDPSWKAPALYQVGLSAERLGNLPAAHAAYARVVAVAAEHSPLRDIVSMAEWRQAHLDWAVQFEAHQRRLLGTAPDSSALVLDRPATTEATESTPES